MEALCYGARTVVDLFETGGLEVERIILTSGLARKNLLLVQTMADVLGRTVEVPDIANGTAVGAAIHGAVAAGIVADYSEGGRRFGARTQKKYAPRPEYFVVYDSLYPNYRRLAADQAIHRSMRELNRIDTERIAIRPS